MSIIGCLQILGEYINANILTVQPRVEPGMAAFMDNADKDHPAKLIFYIDQDRELLDVTLTVYSDAFRAFASSVASGGGSTSGSGGSTHNHTFSLPNHRHTAWIHTSSFLLAAGGSAEAATSVLVLDPSEVSGGTSDSTTGEHTHTTPDHTHPISFGIYEYQYAGVDCYAAVRAFVNDASCVTPISAFGTIGSAEEQISCTRLSIKSLYNASGSGSAGELAPGVNTLFLAPLADATKNPMGLIRLYATVDVRYKS